jgi:hypothetical protein
MLKSVFETAGQHLILHPERIVGKPEIMRGTNRAVEAG